MDEARATVLVAAASTLSALAGLMVAPMLLDFVSPVAGFAFEPLGGNWAAQLVVATLAFGFGALGAVKLAQEMSGKRKAYLPHEADDFEEIDTAVRAADKARRP